MPLHGVGVERRDRDAGAATTTAADEAGGLQFLIGPTDRAGGQVEVAGKLAESACVGSMPWEYSIKFVALSASGSASASAMPPPSGS